MSFSNVPPNSREAENALLSCCLTSPEALEKAIRVVGRDDFYHTPNAIVWGAVYELALKRLGVDMLTVRDVLTREGKLDAAGGVEYLLRLTGLECILANADHYALMVSKKAMFRRQIYAADKIRSAAYLENEADVEEGKGELVDIRVGGGGGELIHIDDGLRYLRDEVDRAAPCGIASSCFVKTGFDAIDMSTGGLPRGGLVVLAARPSMGKTTLSDQIAQNISRDSSVAVFSLEDPSLYFLVKAVSVAGQVSSNEVLLGPIMPGTHEGLRKGFNALYGRKLWYSDRRCKMSEIHSKSRRLKARQGELGCVVIDRIELTDDEQKSQQRVHFIGELSKQAAGIAKDLDVPVLLIVQLSRKCEERSDKRPVLSDLRDSGAIEQDAQMVMFVYRDGYYDKKSEKKGIAEILIPKTKIGPTGYVELAWVERIPMFADLAGDDGGKYRRKVGQSAAANDE